MFGGYEIQYQINPDMKDNNGDYLYTVSFCDSFITGHINLCKQLAKFHKSAFYDDKNSKEVDQWIAWAQTIPKDVDLLKPKDQMEKVRFGE